MQQRPLEEEEEEEEEEEDDSSYFDSSCFDFFDSRKTLLTPLPSGKLTRSVDTVACSPVPQNHDEAHQLVDELATHSARATFNFQQNIYTDFPHQKDTANCIIIAPFLSRSVEKRGDQSDSNAENGQLLCNSQQRTAPEVC
jgi:hypothetical protein